jgi:hypothetical protein
MVRSSQHSLGLCELVLLLNLACSLASKSGALPLITPSDGAAAAER